MQAEGQPLTPRCPGGGEEERWYSKLFTSLMATSHCLGIGCQLIQPPKTAILSIIYIATCSIFKGQTNAYKAIFLLR